MDRVGYVKRVFDILLAIFLTAIFSIPMLAIAVLIKLTSPGPVLYWSERIGKNNTIFRMPKFRTMKIETPVVATHLLTAPQKYMTPMGRILRKFSLDELPQLLSVLKGQMSFVGPRPALYNQQDLIEMRTERGIHRLIPGITGWSQINGRDDLPIDQKVDLDEFYLKHRSFLFDLKTVYLTIFSVMAGKGIQH